MALFEVRRGLGAGFGNQGAPPVGLTTLGQLIITDFYLAAILDGRGYQVRIGSITTPVVGDVLITDTAAEMCADAAAGTTILPVALNVDIESLGGTLPQIAAKSVATVSSSGTAFTPLPLKSDASASVSTARAQAAGSVTVTAEAVTTTPVHYMATLDGVDDSKKHHEFRPPPVLVGAYCFYVQVAGVATGPSYFGSFDYLEFETLLVNPS